MLNNGEIVAKGIPKHVLEEEKLKNVYGINIKTFMLNVLRKWEQ